MDSDENEDNDEEIENLLDSALPEELKNKKREYEERFKIIMEGKDYSYKIKSLVNNKSMHLFFRKRTKSL